MSFAHVDSIDALKELRNALWKFAEAANQSLSEADADLDRMLNWLEHDARVHWQGQIRRRTLELNQAKESLRSKQAVTRRDGSKYPAIEEEKAVAAAEARLQQAGQRLEAVKQYAKSFQREALQYRAAMQRFVMDVRGGVPDAAAHLEGLIGSLTAYTSLEEAGSVAPTVGSQEGFTSMKRAEELEPTTREGVEAADSQGPSDSPEPTVPSETDGASDADDPQEKG